MKKMTSLLCVMLVAVVFLSACGSTADSSSTSTVKSTLATSTISTTVPESDGKQVTLKIAIAVASTPKDLQLVMDEASKKTLNDFNAKLEAVPISWSAWTQQITLMISSGEQLDAMMELGTNFGGDVAKGMLTPIDDLLAKYGQDTAKTVGTDYLKCGQVNGKTYSIPTIRDMAASYGIVFRKDILDKYKIDVNTIKTVDDIEKVFKIVKAGEPNLAITWTIGNIVTIVDQLLRDRDILGDGFGQLLNRGQDNLKVVDWYETPEYKEQLKLVRRWNQEGYVLQDASTNKELATDLVKAGKLFSYCANLKPGYDQLATNMAGGTEMVSVTINPALTTTSQIATIGWAISSTSIDPAKAMQFLNLLYTDADFINIFDWGIEGNHYKKIGDNVIDFADGVDASNSGYNINMGYMFGNQLKSYIWKGEDPNIYKDLDAFNKGAILSKALGCQFDTTNYKNEIASVTNVMNQYKYALEFGIIDTDEYLPKFISALKDAGIDKIISEKQKQLDEWAANQKK